MRLTMCIALCAPVPVGACALGARFLAHRGRSAPEDGRRLRLAPAARRTNRLPAIAAADPAVRGAARLEPVASAGAPAS